MEKEPSNKFPKAFALFDPGFAVPNAFHPVLESLEDPYFKKIQKLTDRVIFLVNHSTLEYFYVTENVKHVFGFDANTVRRWGITKMAERLHADDLNVLQATVYPSFFKRFHSLKTEDQRKMTCAYTFRFLNSNGAYVQILQRNVSLSIQDGNVILSMAVCTDISAFKKDEDLYFKNVLVQESGEVVLLDQRLPGHPFTARQIQILEHTAKGLSEKEIAEQLCLSVHTIKTHKKAMMAKAAVKNASQLVQYGSAKMLL